MKPEHDSAARRIVLSRIRSALVPQGCVGDAAAAWNSIPRHYRRESSASRSEVLALFTARLRDYDAQVLRCEPAEIVSAIEQMLQAREARAMLVPQGFPQAWLPQGLATVNDDELSAAALDACSGVVTTCTLGIAETGTIVLQNAPGQGRRALSLVPDYHLCIVDASLVVATVSEAMSALHATASLPTTFISGPSATADIEMTRIKGVHGPRFLDVLLIGDAEGRFDKQAQSDAV